MWKIEKTVKKGDYMYAIVRDHPYRTKNDYVLLHRVVMENHLGRLLDKDEVVHHKDKDKFNNAIENLEVLTKEQHAALHGKQAGEAYALLKCPGCGKIFEVQKHQTFLVKHTRYTCCSRSCRGRFSKYIQDHGMTKKAKDAIAENLVSVYKKYK